MFRPKIDKRIRIEIPPPHTPNTGTQKVRNLFKASLVTIGLSVDARARSLSLSDTDQKAGQEHTDSDVDVDERRTRSHQRYPKPVNPKPLTPNPGIDVDRKRKRGRLDARGTALFHEFSDTLQSRGTGGRVLCQRTGRRVSN